MDEKDIGSRIRQRREEKKLNLSELARRAGVGKSALSKLESGDSQNPSVHTVVALAAALGTTVEDLMGIESEQSILMIPASLQEFVARARLPSVDAQMLASINYRGKRPVSRLDWWFLYEAIKRSVKGEKNDG